METRPKKIIFRSGYKVCISFLSKLRGLMFSKPKILVFVFDREMHHFMHMFFVFFPIDVLFLDENKTQIDFGENNDKATDLWNNLLQEEIDVEFHTFKYEQVGNIVLDAMRVEPLLDRIIVENGTK